MKKREADKVKAEKQDWWEWQEMDHSIQDSIQERKDWLKKNRKNQAMITRINTNIRELIFSFSSVSFSHLIEE